MFKSVVFPGWGQWSNGQRLKAAVVFGAEGYLIYRAVRAGIEESELRDEARGSSREAELLAEAESWNEERRDYTWWALFAMILSMGDAYVDAHLRGFDVEFEPEGRDVRAGLRLTF